MSYSAGNNNNLYHRLNKTYKFTTLKKLCPSGGKDDFFLFLFRFVF